MKKFLITAFIISGLGLVAWPLMFFTSIFVWDAPIRSNLDMIQRVLIMSWIIGYPVVWAICLGVGCLAVAKSWKKTVIAMIIIPYLYILSKAVVMLG